MEANPGNFQCMLLRLSNSKNKNSPFELVINDIVIKGEESVKLVGVYIDKKLNFHEHISYICRKGRSTVKCSFQDIPIFGPTFQIKPC